MASLTTAAYTNAMKRLYPNGLRELWYPKCPFGAVIKKSTNFEGISKGIRSLYAPINGSTTFATALAGKSTPSVADFAVTRVKDYVIGSIDNEAMMATRSNAGASARALDSMIKSATYEFARSLSFQLWNNGGGARGQLDGTAVGVTTVNLLDINDIVKFEVGMVVEASVDDGTLAGGVRAGSVTITGINRATGGLTAAANWNAAGNIPALAVSDYLFRAGDYANVISGTMAWCPIAAPGAGAFFGVVRTADSRLGGFRINGAGAPIEETVFDAQAEALINGANPDLLIMHPKRMAELRKNMHSKGWVPVDIPTDTKISFKGIGFNGPSGTVAIMEDHMCPYDQGLLTEKAAWELAALGDVPHFKKQGGDRFVWETTADAVEFRLAFYGNLCCHDTAANVNITW